MKHLPSIGTKVRYRTEFLQNICCCTGPLPRARGVITAVKELSPDCVIVSVDWDLPDVPNKIHLANLEVIRS